MRIFQKRLNFSIFLIFNDRINQRTIFNDIRFLNIKIFYNKRKKNHLFIFFLHLQTNLKTNLPHFILTQQYS